MLSSRFAPLSLRSLQSTTTLFVKNLNFQTTNDNLRDHFDSLVGSGSVVAATIPLNKSGGSQGYGFVQFKGRKEMEKGRKLGGTLGGHELECKVSEKVLEVKKGGKRKKVGKKIVVRNVPFQATRQDLQQLFGSVGTLRKVTIPKKFDGTSRGFAFVEYVDGEDAKRAMGGLGGGHLLGRRMVMEWAEEEGKGGEEGGGKRTKL